MTITEILIDEHKDIIELLNIMSKIARNIKSNDVFYTSDVEDIIDFLKFFIDRNHHGKEEILFPTIISPEIKEENESLNEILYEHTLARNYLKDIYSCVENCKIGNAFSGELLADSLTNYVVLIKEHIQKEEKVIFPMAEEVLSSAKQNEIYGQFERLESKLLTKDFRDHYHKLLENLQAKYPG
jgi:hemerythrin-like domain-containing protein